MAERATGLVLRVAPGALLLVLLLSGLACRGGSAVPEGLVQLDLDKRNEGELIRYYLGGFVLPDARDPFEAGLTVEIDGAQFVSVEQMRRLAPDAAAELERLAVDGVLNWDGFVAFVDSAYSGVRRPWETLAALRSEVKYDSLSADWLTVRIRGVMSTAERVLYVPVGSIREALSQYMSNGGQVRYPVGTVILAEHFADGAFDEATVMRRRMDEFWDFFVYDREGRLATSTRPRPKPLASPVQCVGCHLGSKLYEPERSFPAPAPPGPHGPRWIRGVGLEVSEETVMFFDEHRRRSDDVLGIYVTLFASELLEQRSDGTIAAEDARLLAELGL